MECVLPILKPCLSTHYFLPEKWQHGSSVKTLTLASVPPSELVNPLSERGQQAIQMQPTWRLQLLMVLNRLSACLFRMDGQKDWCTNCSPCSSTDSVPLFSMPAILPLFSLSFSLFLICLSLFPLLHFLLHLFSIFLSTPACRGPERSWLDYLI